MHPKATGAYRIFIIKRRRIGQALKNAAKDRLDASWTQAGRKLDASWTEAGRKLDGSWTHAGRKLDGTRVRNTACKQAA